VLDGSAVRVEPCEKLADAEVLALGGEHGGRHGVDGCERRSVHPCAARI